MANIRVKDLDTKASFASDDEILMDSPSGTGTMLRDAFIAAVASQIVAAPSTYKIATLDGANKLTSSQDPSQSVSYLGEHDMVANSPALADGSGTAGDTYYVTNPGTRNYGSGNITAQEGDALVYSGSVWQLVEGIANILDGISTASTARTTLEVNSIDEDAQAYALKTTAPALYFNGTSSEVTVADDDKFSFTDGTDDLPFSISAFVKANDFTNAPIVSKYSGLSTAEWVFYGNSTDYFGLFLIGPGSVYQIARTASTITSYEDEWVHLCATYAGSGPSAASGVSFANANQAVELYINGVLQTKGTPVTSGTYAGMANTTNIVRIGRYTSIYFDGSIRDVKIFNRELTATEVAQLARGTDLGFSSEWGGAFGGVYTSDFSAGANNWSGVNGTADGDIDTIGGLDDNLRFTLSGGAGQHRMSGASVSGLSLVAGKRYSIKFDYRIPSGNAACDGIRVFAGAGSAPLDVNLTGTYDTWLSHTWNVTWSGSADYFSFYPTDGGSTTVDGDGDVFYVRNIKVTQLGALADFRAEDYNESASKLLDRSSNNFVGVGTSVTLTGNQRHISADTIDLKNLPTSSAGLSAGEVWSNGGVLTVV